MDKEPELNSADNQEQVVAEKKVEESLPQKNDIEEQNSKEIEDKRPKEKKKGKKIFIIISVVIILLAIMVGGYIYFTNDKNNENKAINENETNNEEQEETKAITYKIAKWNNAVYTPSKSFYKTGEEYTDYEEATYSTIATLTTGETIVRAFGWYFEDIFLIDNNNIKLLKQYSLSDKENLISEINIDKESTIPEMFPESNITYNGLTLVFEYHGLNSGEFAIDETKSKKVEATNIGDLYEYKYYISDDFYVRRFYVKTADKEALHYYEIKDIDNIYNNDNTLNVNWTDSNNKTISFQMPISDCGNNGSRLHIKDFTPAKGIEIGTIVTNNKPLYKLNDDNLLKLIYNEYYDVELENHDISFEEYKTKLTSVVYEDVLGEWIVITNNAYSHSEECGKPVIYLYPEKDTYVNVAVGANVTVSDPYYTQEGWKNVLARPNGTLIYQGKEHDSLFWEGKGKGMYPNVSKIGKIVAQDKLLTTIKQDLKNQGLNEKEIADFMKFWKDNLPKSPYVKITWLTTEQMNALAPLRITPKPDTVIRVFLDAKGLSKPIDLVPQKLIAKERKGFTLIEWGGLLKK